MIAPAALAMYAVLILPHPTKTIHLTFDADMTPKMEMKLAEKTVDRYYDPQIFEYLQREHLPATVFVTGMFAETYPEVVKQWDANGLLIENHSYDHPGFASSCHGLAVAKTDEQRKEEVTKAQTAIFNVIGKTPTEFRYPGLCHTAATDKIVTGLGLRIEGADDVSWDAFAKGTKKIIPHILARAHDGATLLFHVGGPNAPFTLQILEQVIPTLEAEGYEIKS